MCKIYEAKEPMALCFKLNHLGSLNDIFSIVLPSFTFSGFMIVIDELKYFLRWEWQNLYEVDYAIQAI